MAKSKECFISVFNFSHLLLSRISLNFQKSFFFFVLVTWQGMSQAVFAVGIVISEEIEHKQLRVFLKITLWIKMVSIYSLETLVVK